MPEPVPMFHEGFRRQVQRLRARLLTAILGAVIGGFVPAVLAARPEGLPPWNHLRFEGRKLVFKASVTLDVTFPEGARSQLRECPEAPGLSAGVEPLARLDVGVKLGDRKCSTLWLDSATGGVLQILETREHASWKLRRLGTAGAHSWRARPERDAQKKLSPEDWTRRRDVHLSWDPALTEGLLPTDSYAMILMACSQRLAEQGRKLAAYTVSHDKVIRVDFENVGEGRLDLDGCVVGVEALRGEVSVRRIQVTARVLNEDDDEDESIGPFGMKGAVRVSVELRTQLPIEVRGRVPHLGEVKVELREAVLTD